jgi:hypothetical protein
MCKLAELFANGGRREHWHMRKCDVSQVPVVGTMKLCTN